MSKDLFQRYNKIKKEKLFYNFLSAGSERLKRTGAEGQRMKEGIQINKVLSPCHCEPGNENEINNSRAFSHLEM